MKYIILNKPYLYVENTIPKTAEWEGIKIVDHRKWDELEKDTTKDEFYVINDFGYDTVAQSGQVSNDRSFCKSLSELVNDKHAAREILKSMKDMPYVLCKDNIVNWPYDKNDKLFAKPIHGFAARGTVRDVKHGTVLEDIGEPYLIEKYIDDKYQRLSVDGYICGDEIGILTTCDNIYLNTTAIQYHYLGYPSRFHDDRRLKERYVEIIRELKKVTKCNNQIIDVEFFAVDGDFIAMEINPRILFNTVPLYPELCGVNQWEFMAALMKGKVLDRPTSPPKTGVVRYSYQCQDPVFIRHDKDTFSIHITDNSTTYSSCDRSKPHWELIKELDEKYPAPYPTDADDKQ